MWYAEPFPGCSHVGDETGLGIFPVYRKPLPLTGQAGTRAGEGPVERCFRIVFLSFRETDSFFLGFP